MCSPGRTILKTGAKEPSSCLRDGARLKLIGSGSGANLGDYWLLRANPAQGLSPSDALRLTLASRPRALRLNRPVADPAVACTALLEAMRSEVEEFDVVHSHIDWLHLPLLSRLGVPFPRPWTDGSTCPGCRMWPASFPRPISFRYPLINVCPSLVRIGAARSITDFPPAYFRPGGGTHVVGYSFALLWTARAK